MTNFLRKLPAMMFAMIALTIVGCNTNEDPVDPTNEKPNAPTELMARSVSETQVALKWTAPTSGPTPTGYLIMYSEVGSSTGTQEISVSGASTTMATVPGLTEGKVYEFMVHAVNGTVESDASNKISWAPARRATGTFRLYGASSSQGSGLGIFMNGSGRTGGPAVLTVAQGDEWDVCFDDGNAASPLVGSPGQSSFVPNKATGEFRNGKVSRIVFLSEKTYVGINSLDEIYESSALTIPASAGEAMLSILPNQAGTKDLGFVIGSDNGDGTVNFAKLLVKRGANGAFVQGSGTDTYIEVQVSYQSFKDVPYALRQAIDNVVAKAAARGRVND